MRLRRKHLRFAAVWIGSLLTAVIVIALIASGWFSFHAAFRGVSIGIYGGRLETSWTGRLGVLGTFAPQWDRNPWAMQWWFDWRTVPLTSTSLYTLMVPLWVPMLLTAASTLFAWRARGRFNPAICPTCGYSQAGVPKGSPCPECGKHHPPDLSTQSTSAT